MIAIKVFSATKANDRETLGERCAKYINDHKWVSAPEVRITQSSDSEFHCLSLTVIGELMP